jgi:beta-ureidopropionase / N-carbamoyl-L-amino-acid hydrolase
VSSADPGGTTPPKPRPLTGGLPVPPYPPGTRLTFAGLWRELEPLGRDHETGGYQRFSWTDADSKCRAWFTDRATERGLAVEADHNGNLWAWWGPPGPGAIATGSHLDSVPGGGAYDGALGVASALAAVDLLHEKNFYPERPVVLAVLTEEEGARWGVPCLGSRLLTGAISPDAARWLTDDDGTTLAEAMAAAGLDPALIGPGDDLLSSIAAFVELHIEQGRALAPLSAAVGIGEGIWPHGRWRLRFEGRADHAGTARLTDRSDPMLPYAHAVLAARQAAAERGTLATFGKVIAEPGGANAVSSSVTAWLDARAGDEAALTETVTAVRSVSEKTSAEHGVALGVRQESYTPPVRFDEGLRRRIAAALAAAGTPAPVLPTGAGHDAGVLAARLPTAMLFVRNPTGVSHSPAERADLADCEAGVRALAAVLEDLARLCGAGMPNSPGCPATAYAATCSSRRTGSASPPSRRAHRSGGRRSGCGASPCPDSPTPTRTPSTVRCAAAPRRATARSGPGASACTGSRSGWTPTATTGWPARPTRR